MTLDQRRLGLSIFSSELAGETPADRRRWFREAAVAGLDHLHIGDHVTFHGGYGWDGLINATALLNMQDDLPVHVGIYQLPLRHPTVVTRQLATLCEMHPGRLVLGVGVGGDDRNEMLACGVDPRTRGKRMEEGLQILRRLLTGEPVTFAGEIFQLDEVSVQPPVPDLPILVGGRSDAALRRTGRYADGWNGIWISPERFAAAIARVAEEADAAGRRLPTWRHALTVWCGFGPDHEHASRSLGDAMHGVYKLPSDLFERWCPAGRPEDVAEFVAPYYDAGATDITLIARGQPPEATVEAAAEVRRLVGGVVRA